MNSTQVAKFPTTQPAPTWGFREAGRLSAAFVMAALGAAFIAGSVWIYQDTATYGPPPGSTGGDELTVILVSCLFAAACFCGAFVLGDGVYKWRPRQQTRRLTLTSETLYSLLVVDNAEIALGVVRRNDVTVTVVNGNPATPEMLLSSLTWRGDPSGSVAVDPGQVVKFVSDEAVNAARNGGLADWLEHLTTPAISE